MKNKQEDKSKESKLDKPLSRESAKAKYENLTDEKEEKSAEQQEDLVEARIRKAMAEGEFDNLPGKGKPIDLSKYYGVPEHLRIAYHMMKGSGYIPEEVRLKKEMEILKEKIKQCKSEDEKHKFMKELTEISQQFHFHMEYNKRVKNSF
jgi:hypothetical protein